MFLRSRIVIALMMLAVAVGACGPAEDTAPPVATPSLALGSDRAAIGGPLSMTYRFAVAPDAPAFAEDYRVFVHFVDADGELMWADDHDPMPSTSTWQPGATIEYERTTFVPRFPYVGQTSILVGLVSPETGERLPLAAETEGLRAYRLASFEMHLDSRSLFVEFLDGWHDTEVSDAGIEWQWTEGEATLSIPNPMEPIVLYLQADQPAAQALPDPQQVEVRVGMEVVDAFALPPGPRQLRRIEVAADQLGTDQMVEVTVGVDRTFVPAAIPALGSADARQLGIRVFRVYAEPQ